MRFSLPFFLSLFLIFVTGGSAADVHRMLHSQRSPGKDYYNVFPTPGSDYNSTASLIKTTVGTDDLNPWTDVKENLVSWTVEADDDQVTTLGNHPGIKQITKLALPAAATPTGADTTTQEVGGSSSALTNRQEEVQEWIILPTNPADMVQVNETAQFLRSLTDSEPTQYFENNDKDLQFWLVLMTDSQHDQAVKNPGISTVGLNVPFTQDSVTDLAAAVSLPRSKRDLSYSTQKDAVRELVSIAQPRYVTHYHAQRDMERYTVAAEWLD